MTVFFTKKQKKLMKERRKKKRLAEQEEPPAVKNNKRPRPSPVASIEPIEEILKAAAEPVPHSVNRIVIPKGLNPQEAKKFRKDARRKARAEGRDADALEFVVDDEPAKKKRRKTNVPCIREALEIAKVEQVKIEQKGERSEDERALPAAYKSRYLALDCEMVGIGSSGQKSALARVSIVDWDGAVVLDTYVKVPDKVTDFRTWVSGVKPKHLKTAMDPAECREKVASILKGKILVGHALKNDLHALMLQHPKSDLRDSAKYRPFQRLNGSKWRPRKLRDLAKEYCDLVIQEDGQSHDSVDDAKASMELFKAARKQWEKELDDKAARLNR